MLQHSSDFYLSTILKKEHLKLIHDSNVSIYEHQSVYKVETDMICCPIVHSINNVHSVHNLNQL